MASGSTVTINGRRFAMTRGNTAAGTRRTTMRAIGRNANSRFSRGRAVTFRNPNSSYSSSEDLPF